MTEKLIRNENEAIEAIKSNIPTSGYYMLREALDMAISALEEIQQYRALGTVEEIKKKIRKELPYMSIAQAKFKSELNSYRALGTLEELREAREKQVQKKPVIKSDKFSDLIQHYYCPSCGSYFGQRGVHNVILFNKEKYCQGEKCGQAIDWSDAE